MFQFDHRFNGVPAKDFGGVLAHQIISALHRVKHMPFGTVGFRISQGGRNAPCAARPCGTGSDKVCRQNSHVALLLSEGERGVRPAPPAPTIKLSKRCVCIRLICHDRRWKWRLKRKNDIQPKQEKGQTHTTPETETAISRLNPFK